MKQFGGPAVLLDRNDINTVEIIPAKYLAESSKTALRSHLLEDLLVDGEPFAYQSTAMQEARVIVAKENFGCGSSREHAVWAFEVNDINVIIATSFARIFRQNMFNCGILAIEIEAADVDRIFALGDDVQIQVDLEADSMTAQAGNESLTCKFAMNPFDKELVAAGGWLAYADKKY
ncbi:3-isopropylmalate dehydratase small subunit [Desulfotalea psychrophila]|uniref:Related to 3-isopropylmalate dehydratase, small subunit n=1 Tax=Desulfotalea psychrophila (strain LSv54 / DSM 12343) TaxID=177439 RepID=Q6ALT8_DESPS|nr:3-isopropylmalate dehydratase small subunit [Desulfotalea psychrophila]CAG36687.1 related to 3-isopropylmalate dehydratase, small subunit [Desulfotalea psychrophila LSv54]